MVSSGACGHPCLHVSAGLGPIYRIFIPKRQNVHRRPQSLPPHAGHIVIVNQGNENKVGRLSSSRHSILLVQIQTKRNSAMTSPSGEKHSTKQIRTRSTGSISPEHKTNTILADEISRHLQSGLSTRRTDFIRKTLLAIAAAAAAGHTGRSTRVSTPAGIGKAVAKRF